MSRLTKLDNDITKVKGTYMPYDERPIITLSNATYIQCLLNKLGKLEDLEEQLGCPLDVYVKIQLGLVDTVYLKGYKTVDTKWHNGEVELIQEEVVYLIHIRRVEKRYFVYRDLFLGDENIYFNTYGQKFWLREDKSE